ncbi:MAG: circularly permuted type 2 ATP-grasp protein, partial [Verrucomicrobia bacterium]|nr:circularly permuted type 2 ATP-grasp protein [Verrucomicrobiota bacterium]
MQTHARPWHEILDSRGRARKQYQPLLEHLESYYSPADLKELEERLEATLRELGISFEGSKSNHQNTWFSDLLPHVFLPDEWELLQKGFEQRIRAFELFLQDVYGQREILRQGVLPIPIILGSPHYHRSAVGLRPPQGSYLHLSGLAVCRDSEGRLTVKNHYFGHASGLSYMVQNRRLLARVVPDLFEHHPVESVAQLPTEILMGLRVMSNLADPAVVLLTPGVASAVYSEHSFLARRMGIPLVQGEDLLVLDGSLFLKTVSGLERVDVVYSRVADPWLDPLVFSTDSRLGVPGLVHCLRKGTVTLVNAVGSQLADDRSLLHFGSAIIRFYLGEWPILPTLTTYWLGDLDQREMVLENLDSFQIRVLTGERFLSLHQSEKGAQEIESEVRKAPHLYVAQPVDDNARTL